MEAQFLRRDFPAHVKPALVEVSGFHPWGWTQSAVRMMSRIHSFNPLLVAPWYLHGLPLNLRGKSHRN